MYTLNLLGPLILTACLDGIMSPITGSAGLICTSDTSQAEVINYCPSYAEPKPDYCLSLVQPPKRRSEF
jgi:hypothetical protein